MDVYKGFIPWLAGFVSSMSWDRVHYNGGKRWENKFACHTVFMKERTGEGEKKMKGCEEVKEHRSDWGEEL